MALGFRESWGLIHGLVLGSFFLLAFAGGLAGLWSMRPEWVTTAGLRERARRLMFGTVVMAVVAWITVITGTYIVYPWYRAPAPQGADLHGYPRNFLLSSPNTAAWHIFGMEWKEHVAWLAPILATAVAYVVLRYGVKLAYQPRIRQALMVLFVLAFLTAAAAGLFGALITKTAPV